MSEVGRFGEKFERILPNEVVLDVDSIERQLRPGRAAAIHGCRRSIDDARHASLQRDQLDRVAAVQRQIDDLTLDDRLRHFRRGGLHERAAGADAERLGECPHFEPRGQRPLRRRR